MTEPRQHIAIFPLNTVLFPGGPLSLRIFEPRYIDMVRECTANNSEFGVCLNAEEGEAGSRRTRAEVGTTARINDFFTMEDGLLGIGATGIQRFSVCHTDVRENGLLVADVVMLPPAPAVTLNPEHLLLRTLLERLLDNLAELYRDCPLRLDDADWVGCRLAELLPLALEDKQVLLETDDPTRRLDLLLEIVPQLQS